MTELHARQQRRLVEEELEAQVNGAWELLRTAARPLPTETLRVVTELVNGSLDRLYS